MPRCRTCAKDWPDSLRVCPDDGAALEGATVVDAKQLAGHAATMGAIGGAVVSVESFLSTGGALTAMALNADLAAGTMVGDYRIEGKLGEGGMGSVYSAIHPLIGKRAAIKVMSASLCTSPVAVERFLQEARSVNQIGHPNIVDVFLFGTLPDGRCYLVMEWLKGETLAARITRGRIPVEEVCAILDPICRALETAHGKGIVHRDLKPDNVFLEEVPDDRPVVKLLDFGIAKLIGDDGRVERTRTGSLLGTPGYVSPEQARGRKVDHRTDIYSLGVMAYEVLLGRPPFVSDNAMDIVSMHLHDPPPAPRTIWPDVPPEVEELLLGMLAKDPGSRPSLATARAVLLRARGGRPSVVTAAVVPPPVVTAPVVSAPESRARRAPLIAGAAVVVLGAALALVLARGGGTRTTRPPEPPPAPAVEPASATPVASPAPAPPVLAAAPPPAPAGTILVEVNVGNARIEIDGAVVAEAAAGARLDVDRSGEHDVVVTAPGRRRFDKTISVTQGATVRVPVKLARAVDPRPVDPADTIAPVVTPPPPPDGDSRNPFRKKKKEP